jgi:outer membrane protein OmpA-like peptidoglycan-associated protein
MKRITSLLLILFLAACQTDAPVGNVPPPEEDVSAPSEVISAPAPPGRADMSERRILLTVNFAFRSHRIRPDSYSVLDNVAAALQDERVSGSAAEINGHTDVTGQLGYNIALSFLRARTVMGYLHRKGVPSQRMRAQGFGPLQLINAANPRDPANRRVEVVSVGP